MFKNLNLFKNMEDKALYRPIISRSWEITKRFKNLWFFGLFVALLGVSGEFEILSRAIYRPSGQPGIIVSLFSGLKNGVKAGISSTGGSFWTNFWHTVAENPQAVSLLAIITIITIAIFIFFVWLAVISQVSLIKNVVEIDSGQKPTINEGIDFAVKKFWPALLINAILKIFLFIIFLVLGWELTTLNHLGIVGITLYYISFVVAVVLIFIISFILRYQLYYILLKKQKNIPALKSAWKLFLKNWLVSIELSLILFVFYLLATVVSSLAVAMAITMPIVLVFFYQWTPWLVAIISVAALILMLVITFTITAILMTFQWSAWTLLFYRLTANSGVSRILRSFSR